MDVQYEHTTLIGREGATFPEEISISFGLVEVKQVTTSSFILWNSGNRTIHGSDITTLDPLRIELSGAGKILKWAVSHKTRDVNGWSFERGPLDRLQISFDFIDPGDGVRLEVTHDAVGRDTHLRGTIKGMPCGVQDRGRRRKGEGKREFFTVAVVNILVGSLVVLYFAFRGWLWVPDSPDPVEGVYFHSAGIALGLFTAYTGVLNFQIYRRKHPAALSPPRH